MRRRNFDENLIFETNPEKYAKSLEFDSHCYISAAVQWIGLVGEAKLFVFSSGTNFVAEVSSYLLKPRSYWLG